MERGIWTEQDFLLLSTWCLFKAGVKWKYLVCWSLVTSTKSDSVLPSSREG